MSLDQATAKRLVDALDSELGRRRAKKDLEEESRWKTESAAARQAERDAAAEVIELIEVLEDSGIHSDGEILKELISRGAENPKGGAWHANQVRALRSWEPGPDLVDVFSRIFARFVDRFEDPASPVYVGPELSDREFDVQRREIERLAAQVLDLGERLQSELHYEDAVAAGTPPRRPVVIRPRVRAPHLLGEGAEPQWREWQIEEAESHRAGARQGRGCTAGEASAGSAVPAGAGSSLAAR